MSDEVGMFKPTERTRIFPLKRDVHLLQVTECARCLKVLIHPEEIAFFSEDARYLCWNCREKMDKK